MKRLFLAVVAVAAFVCSCEKPVAAPDGTVERVGQATEVSCDGGIVEFNVSANCPWSVTASEGLIVSPSSGVADVPVAVIVEVPQNQIMEKQSYELVFTFTNSKAETKEFKFTIEVAASDKLFYGGVAYKTALMKDGNIWMAENLRYVPAGKTPSSNKDDASGFWYPLVCDGTNLNFSTNDADVEAFGYLYSAEFVFGAINASNSASFEGKQGICPDGWHIPTVAECVALVGKSNKNAAGEDLTNENAPYYDKTKKNGSLALLAEDDNNFTPVGMVSYTDVDATKGTLSGATGTAPNKKINTGYFMGSSLYKNIEKSDKSFKNAQFFALMPSASAGSINVSYLGYRFGVSIRCVKDAPLNAARR